MNSSRTLSLLSRIHPSKKSTMPKLRGEQQGPKAAPSRLRCTYNWWQTKEGKAFVSSGLPLAALETWDLPLKQRLRRNPTKTWKQVELDRVRAVEARRKAARAQRRQVPSAAANAPAPPGPGARASAPAPTANAPATAGLDTASQSLDDLLLALA